MNTTTLNMTTLDGGVIIKKGGGGTPTPPSGESNIEYLDVRASAAGTALKAFSNVARLQTDEFVMILPTITIIAGGYDTSLNNVTHIKVDWGNRIVFIANGEIHEISLIDFVMEAGGVSKEELDALPRLTKEQFYSLD